MHASIARWGGAAVLAAAVAITGTACGTSTPTASHTSQSAPTAPVAVAATPSAMDTWCAGTGAADLLAVKADMAQINTDASNYDAAAIEADGAQLETDATAATAAPPPVSNAHKFNYTLGMGWYLNAGSKAAAGDFTGAASALSTGNGYIGQAQGVLPAGCAS